MSEAAATVVADSSPARQEIELPRAGTPEYAEWRMTGEIPAKEAPAANVDSQTTDATKGSTSEDEGESETPSKQEQPGKKPSRAEDRIKELLAENKRLKQQAKTPPEPVRETKPATAEAVPQTYQEWRKTFDESKWAEQYAKDNPTASYEKLSAAMSDYLWEVRDNFRAADQQRQADQKRLTTELDQAKSRYGENILHETISPAITAIVAQTSGAVRQMVNDSPVLSHLLYTIGSDPQTLADFIKMANSNPRGALKYIAKIEDLIEEELGKETTSKADASAARNDKGQFVADKPLSPAPAKRGPESAAPPPLDVGSRGAGPKDESTRALSALTSGDNRAFRDYMRAENAKDLRRRRGA